MNVEILQLDNIQNLVIVNRISVTKTNGVNMLVIIRSSKRSSSRAMPIWMTVFPALLGAVVVNAPSTVWRKSGAPGRRPPKPATTPAMSTAIFFSGQFSKHSRKISAFCQSGSC